MRTLKTVFKRIASKADALEDTASAILDILREARIRDLGAFNALVAEAYHANGWRMGSGRPPAEDDGLTSAPDAVRAYVSQVRAAYSEKLDVLGFETMYALRKEVARVRRMKRSPRARIHFPEFAGVELRDATELNGALFHDLLVLYEHVPEDVRESINRRVKRMLTEFRETAEIDTAA